jgi:DNA-binding HxlR family transcriptional regulator
MASDDDQAHDQRGHGHGRFSSPAHATPGGTADGPRDGGTDLFQKWIPEICAVLLDRQPMRYGELQQAVEGIGSKTLARKLRRLCALGLATRNSFDEIPPRVEYALTDFGDRFAQRVVDASSLVTHDDQMTPPLRERGEKG